MKKKKEKKSTKLPIILIITFLLLIGCLIIYEVGLKNITTDEPKQEAKTNGSDTIEDTSEYDACMRESYYAEETKTKIQEFLNANASEPFSIYFTDINNNYTITKNVNSSYYGASVIKLLEATYVLRKAMNNEISLDDTLTYQSRDSSDDSLGMENFNIGDKIPISEVIKYAISYSDNTAHEMLFNYIGITNLRNYATSLGIRLTIDDVEHYGFLTTDYMNKMLQEAYSIILSGTEYGELLSTAMDNDYYNFLNFDNIRFSHKAGWHASAYNEAGIYISENPYLISILSSYGYQDYENIVKNISKQVYEIYTSNLELKEEYCRNI